MHAALDLAAKHMEEFLHWQKTSNTIVVLACKNEEELKKFAEKVISKGFQVVVFQEPDLENQVTSISIVPKEGVKKICSGLPLAGKVKTRLEASYIPWNHQFERTQDELKKLLSVRPICVKVYVKWINTSPP